MKRVYEYGGIYLDTDVKINRSFDKLLSHNAFINFIFGIGVYVGFGKRGSLGLIEL